MKCPVLVERFRLDNLREPVLRVISLSLLISNNIDKKAASTFNASVVEEMTSELKKLPQKTVKDLLMFNHGLSLKMKEMQVYTKSRYTLFAAWFSLNEDICSVEEKSEILGSFYYEDLTVAVECRGVVQAGGDGIGNVIKGKGATEEMVMERMKKLSRCQEVHEIVMKRVRKLSCQEVKKHVKRQ